MWCDVQCVHPYLHFHFVTPFFMSSAMLHFDHWWVLMLSCEFLKSDTNPLRYEWTIRTILSLLMIIIVIQMNCLQYLTAINLTVIRSSFPHWSALWSWDYKFAKIPNRSSESCPRLVQRSWDLPAPIAPIIFECGRLSNKKHHFYYQNNLAPFYHRIYFAKIKYS